MERAPRWILVVGLLFLVVLVWVFARVWKGGKGEKTCPRREPMGASFEGTGNPERYRAARVPMNPGRSARKDDSVREVFGWVRSEEGTVVTGAAVRLVVTGRDIRFALTDSFGRFAIPKVPRRAERMEVSARGYQSQLFERPVFPSAEKVRWDVTLVPARGVHGVVLAGEKPAVGALVRIAPAGQSEETVDKGRTDLSGRFSLKLEVGPSQAGWVVEAYHAQHGRAKKEVPGPGEVTIRLPGGGFVEGKVVDGQNYPVRQFSLTASSLLRGRGGPAAQTFEGSDGRFRLGPLAPGTHRIYAAAEGFQPARAGPVKVESGETHSGLTITLKGSGVVKGRVTDRETGAPIEGALVAPAEWRASTLAESVGSHTGPDGRYRLRSVPGARTSLKVTAEGYLALLAGGVDCRPGEEVERDFALSPVGRKKRAVGELTGIGAVLTKTGDGVRIIKTLANGPAAELLEAGDLVVMVDDLEVKGAGLGEVAQAIRGETDTEVVLWVLKGGSGEPQRVVINRKRVVLPDKK